MSAKAFSTNLVAAVSVSISDPAGLKTTVAAILHAPRGSKYPIFKDFGSKNHTLNGVRDRSPYILGTWTLWGKDAGGLELRQLSDWCDRRPSCQSLWRLCVGLRSRTCVATPPVTNWKGYPKAYHSGVLLSHESLMHVAKTKIAIIVPPAETLSNACSCVPCSLRRVELCDATSLDASMLFFAPYAVLVSSNFIDPKPTWKTWNL